MKYLTRKTKDKLCIAIRCKLFSSLSVCEEKFMAAHFEMFLNYRTKLESMFLPIHDRESFTSRENDYIINLYLNKTPIYIIKDSLPFAQDWLREADLRFDSILILKKFIDAQINLTRTRRGRLAVGGGGADWTEGGQDRWGYKSWLLRDGKNFDLWNGPMGEQ